MRDEQSRELLPRMDWARARFLVMVSTLAAGDEALGYAVVTNPERQVEAANPVWQRLFLLRRSERALALVALSRPPQSWR
jgi:hypothetical protein